MAFEHRDGSGALFKNDKHTSENNQPNARGDALIGGVLYEVSAWTKEGSKGRWQSLAFKPKDQKPKEPQAAPKSSKAPADDSDLPF